MTSNHGDAMILLVFTNFAVNREGKGEKFGNILCVSFLSMILIFEKQRKFTFETFLYTLSFSVFYL